MTPAPRGPVVIDTGVLGAQLTPRTWPLGELYRPLIEGRAALILFITVAELRFGAQLAVWGPRRLGRLERELEQAETIWPGPDLTGTYVALRAWCVKTGHGLGQKEHEADRWVAATAIWLDVPLVAHDAIFANVGGAQSAHQTRPLGQDHRAINVQLAGDNRGQIRLLADKQRRRSRSVTAPIGVLPKLIVRVRFMRSPSPANHDWKYSVAVAATDSASA